MNGAVKSIKFYNDTSIAFTYEEEHNWWACIISNLTALQSYKWTDLTEHYLTVGTAYLDSNFLILSHHYESQNNNFITAFRYDSSYKTDWGVYFKIEIDISDGQVMISDVGNFNYL